MHTHSTAIFSRREQNTHHRGTETTEKGTSPRADRDLGPLFVEVSFCLRLLSVTSVSLW